LRREWDNNIKLNLRADDHFDGEDERGSGSCPKVGFSISDAEPSGSATTVLKEWRVLTEFIGLFDVSMGAARALKLTGGGGGGGCLPCGIFEVCYNYYIATF
jgi:hypothetical protein